MIRLETRTASLAGPSGPTAAKLLGSAFLGGALVAGLFFFFHPPGGERRDAEDPTLRAGLGSGVMAGLMASLTASAQQHLGDGEYLFLPNRRTVWVVNHKNGRFANFHFRNDQEGTILRSRVVTLDRRDFPPDETVYLLSDRNLTEVLWVCNSRTGDVQLWQPRLDGNVVLAGTIATSVHLMEQDR